MSIPQTQTGNKSNPPKFNNEVDLLNNDTGYVGLKTTNEIPSEQTGKSI